MVQAHSENMNINRRLQVYSVENLSFFLQYFCWPSLLWSSCVSVIPVFHAPLHSDPCSSNYSAQWSLFFIPALHSSSCFSYLLCTVVPVFHTFSAPWSLFFITALHSGSVIHAPSAQWSLYIKLLCTVVPVFHPCSTQWSLFFIPALHRGPCFLYLLCTVVPVFHTCSAPWSLFFIPALHRGPCFSYLLFTVVPVIIPALHSGPCSSYPHIGPCPYHWWVPELQIVFN